ncbi:MAG TPA: hypothetical protein P5146_02825 [Desulfomonilia bacterium]|jgi:hypothetical protein|nr:hypothetical protein [Desulfomonilia bacterium]HRR68209.1 hypothetical protein [Desulfomonilia bacterium]HRT44930.1 hypothetical protein [Desulfomonilia bacterium]
MAQLAIVPVIAPAAVIAGSRIGRRLPSPAGLIATMPPTGLMALG